MRNLDTNMFAALDRYREQGEPMALATIFQTLGSTYRKAGARMLLDSDGKYYGLLGGGCFEGDLVEHARSVIKSDDARIVEYDLRAGTEAIWGLGLGCNGAVRILLQLLSPTNDYQPAAFISEQRAAGNDSFVASVVSPPDEDNNKTPLGTSFWCDQDAKTIFSDIDHDLTIPVVTTHIMNALRDQDHALTDFAQYKIYCERIRRPRRLLLLGGGPDAQPLAQIAMSLGWHVSVCDHRTAYLQDWTPGRGLSVHESENGNLPGNILESICDAALVMSHHFATDLGYLQQIADSTANYIGVLGPEHRKRLLLESLDDDVASKLEQRLFGPVGLNIGGNSPETIALSAMSEIQCVLDHAGGGHLGAPSADARQIGQFMRRA